MATDTLSDEKNSTNTLVVSQESKGEHQSSSHSRKKLPDRTLENIRNLKKAEQELRGIFQSVKYYEFPVMKDADGTIKIIGKYQRSKRGPNLPVRPPSRLKYNPIVHDKKFKRVDHHEMMVMVGSQAIVHSSSDSTERPLAPTTLAEALDGLETHVSLPALAT